MEQWPDFCFTPFFFTPSVGGGIDVDVAPGVSTAFEVCVGDSAGASTLVGAVTGGFRSSGISFAGDSCLTPLLAVLGSTILRSDAEGTLSITSLLDVADLRRGGAVADFIGLALDWRLVGCCG